MAAYWLEEAEEVDPWRVEGETERVLAPWLAVGVKEQSATSQALTSSQCCDRRGSSAMSSSPKRFTSLRRMMCSADQAIPQNAAANRNLRTEQYLQYRP